MTEAAPEGLLLIDKRPGATSHDLVAQVRRLLGRRRTGHAGTLDPFATGLLPMMLGRATRLIRFLPSSPKRYEGVLTLGAVTDTDDATGRVLQRYDGPLPGPDQVRTAAARLTGEILQAPPSFSAKKVEGKRAYRSAREGTLLRLEPVPVEVFDLELFPGGDRASYRFSASVSPGTYIRALARDLGDLLGCGGHLTALRRTSIGPLSVLEAIRLDRDRPVREIPDPDLAERVLPLNKIPLELESVALAAPGMDDLFLAGGRTELPGDFPEGSLVRVLGRTGALLGVGEIAGNSLQPKVVLN